MGLFETLKSRNKPTVNPQKMTSGQAASHKAAESQGASKGPKSPSSVSYSVGDGRSHSASDRSVYSAPSSIPSAQAFVTNDPFNAYSPVYRQSTMAKDQARRAQRADEAQQAIQQQSVQSHEATSSTAPRGQWPSRTRFEFAVRNMRDPAYQAEVAHLNFTQEDFNLFITGLSIFLEKAGTPGRLSRAQMEQAAKETCKDMNVYLSGELTKYCTVDYYFDLDARNIALRIMGPPSYETRIEWIEKVKAPYWNAVQQKLWRENKDTLPL